MQQNKYGFVAQLGERSVRIREVEGSSPFGSTKRKRTSTGCPLSFDETEKKGLELKMQQSCGLLPRPVQKLVATTIFAAGENARSPFGSTARSAEHIPDSYFRRRRKCTESLRIHLHHKIIEYHCVHKMQPCPLAGLYFLLSPHRHRHAHSRDLHIGLTFPERLQRRH